MQDMKNCGVAIHLIQKWLPLEKKLARVERKRGHKGQVSFPYCFAYSEAKKTSLKAKKNGNYFVRSTG